MAYSDDGLTDDERRERNERESPTRDALMRELAGRDDFEERGYRDLYPNSVKDIPRTESSGSSSSSGGSSREDALRRVQDAYNRAGVDLDSSDINRFRDPTLKHDEDVPGFESALMTQLGLRAASNAPRGTPGRASMPQYSGGGSGDSGMSAFLQYLERQQARQEAERASMRELLMTQLGEAQKPVGVNDPGIREVLGAQRLSGQRSAERMRTVLAERLAADNLGDSGAFDTGVQGIEQDRAFNETQATGQVLGREMEQRRMYLTQLLQLAVASGDAESARTLQAQLVALNSQMQNSQFNARLGFDYDALGQQGALAEAGLNQSAILALLGGV